MTATHFLDRLINVLGPMDPSQKIRVLVVDDHPLMVAGMVGEINAQPDHDLAEDKFVAALQELHIANPWDRSRETARNVCLRTSSKLEIATSIEEKGNGFEVELDGIRCDSNKIVANARAFALARPDVIHALGVKISQLRAELGEPASTREKFNIPPETAISASPEAIQLLFDGYKRAITSDFPGSIPKYKQAI